MTNKINLFLDKKDSDLLPGDEVPARASEHSYAAGKVIRSNRIDTFCMLFI